MKKLRLLLLFLAVVQGYSQETCEQGNCKELADAGHPKYMYQYAEYLLTNKPNGLKKDLETALTYYQQAAEHDYIPALMALADFWVTSDKEAQILLGLNYLMEACDNLYPTACEILGRMDYTEAKKGITPKFRDWLWYELENSKDPYLKPNRYKALRNSFRGSTIK